MLLILCVTILLQLLNWHVFFQQSYSFRRGTYPSTIFSLSFGPSKQLPDILAASSSSGSIHLFTLGFASHPRRELQLKIFFPTFHLFGYFIVVFSEYCHISLGFLRSLMYCQPNLNLKQRYLSCLTQSPLKWTSKHEKPLIMKTSNLILIHIKEDVVA